MLPQLVKIRLAVLSHLRKKIEKGLFIFILASQLGILGSSLLCLSVCMVVANIILLKKYRKKSSLYILAGRFT
jgi:hypothetical protein